MRIPSPVFVGCLSLALFAAPAQGLLRADAEAQVLEGYDLRGGSGLQMPLVRAADRPALKWLLACAEGSEPANPFSKGTPAWKEAEGIRALWGAQPEAWAKLISDQPLTLTGSYLAYWRWAQLQVRNGRMTRELRTAWEDRLLASRAPGMIQGFALRHALSFALAEADEPRFAQLKERWSDLDGAQILAFQRAFALLGSPSPRFRVWRLPDLRPDDMTLGEMGTRKIWMAADSGEGLPDLGPDTAWLVPTLEGAQPEGEDSLLEPGLSEAKRLNERLQKAGRKAYLAPVREPFERCALMYFPIRIELTEAGLIRTIQMGDAALVRSVSK